MLHYPGYYINIIIIIVIIIKIKIGVLLHWLQLLMFFPGPFRHMEPKLFSLTIFVIAMSYFWCTSFVYVQLWLVILPLPLRVFQILVTLYTTYIYKINRRLYTIY
jgi:hypothetical protein